MSNDYFRSYSFRELCEQADAINQQRRARRQWGPWRLDTESLELVFRDKQGRDRYYVDLERMGSAAAMLDWVFQVAKKTWCTAADAGHLVEALEDIFDPQARLCSFACSGAPDKALDAAAFLRRRYPAAGGAR